MPDPLSLAAAARAERRQRMLAIPEALLGGVTQQIDRLTLAKLLRRKIDEERNLRDAAIRVKTEEAQNEKAQKEKRERAVAMAMAGQLSPEAALATGIPEAVEASLRVSAEKDVGGLPNLEAVRGFEPQNPYQAAARGKRVTELVDAGEMEREEETRKQREDVSKSITAATSLEELDRIDTGGDSPLGTSLNRKRKVLAEEEDRVLGEALAGYKGDAGGLTKVFEEKGIKPTPGQVARAEDIVFKRASQARAVKDMEGAEEARKAGKVKDAAGLYTKAANSLNAQIDDIEKKAVVEERNIATGAITRSFDPSRLTAADQTLLTRLKTDRLKAVDALTEMANSGETSTEGMSPEEKRALLERLVKELEGK